MAQGGGERLSIGDVDSGQRAVVLDAFTVDTAAQSNPFVEQVLIMRSTLACLISLGFAVVMATEGAAQTTSPVELRAPSAFSSIDHPAARSRALFGEAAKVFTSPRCINCHPAGDRPSQGNDRHPHVPLVTRNESFTTCHTDKNFTLMSDRASYQSIPGHPRWSVAPIEMAWQGKSIGEMCRQMRDPDRNGGRSLVLLHEHVAHDDLVGWGWKPGEGRESAPGTQELLGQLIQAWIDSGAECP
jgi:hypothetical protein